MTTASAIDPTVSVTSFEPPVRVREVVIDALAAMKIIKHCDENHPTLVNGVLLGLDINGILEITFSYPSLQKVEPETTNIHYHDKNNNPNNTINDAEHQQEAIEYQTEMMKMLREVNIDNNCVGWYHSTNLGTISTKDIVANQLNFQTSEDISPNAVVIVYDPILSKRGNIVLKAYRLSNAFLQLKRSKQIKFMKPQEIMEELPLSIRTTGHLSGVVTTLQDTHEDEIDCDFDPLNSQGVETLAEKYLELITSRLDEIQSEQNRFQGYARSQSKLRHEHLRWMNKRIQENEELREMGEYEHSIRLEDAGLKLLPDLNTRHEHLLAVDQLDRYCEQLNEHLTTSLEKLTLLNQIHNPSS